jgi:non-ribosomal peptide synthetase component F
LESVITEYRVTGLWLTAGLFHLMAEQCPGCFAGVGEVWTGGDVVSAAAVTRVLDACPATKVVNGYGPTETTTNETSRPGLSGLRSASAGSRSARAAPDIHRADGSRLRRPNT